MKSLLLVAILLLVGGCSTLRTTDPPRTATEQYLLNEATRRSIDQLMTVSLRDRVVFVDTSYIIGSKYPGDEFLFLAAELRSRLLQGGARMINDRDKAQVVIEVRAVGVGIDRLETIIGIPSVSLPSQATGSTNVPVLTPEIAIVKTLRQRGYSSVAFVAYWRDTGEIVASSGPFLGKTKREDFWILGFGPRTLGTIPPAKE
jgi:hypothetical protein